MRKWTVMAIVVGLAATGLGAERPEQFRVWGTAGPQFPPVPKGWREVRAPADPAVAPTPQEQQRGYVLFAREPLAAVSPTSRPFASERVGELRTVAARGEYEPVSFAIHALEPLSGVRVQLGELRSGQGGRIPSDHADVRVVRAIRVRADAKAKTYRLEPFLLEKRPAFDVPRGRTARVWLTLKVPETAAPGDYTGTISVQAAGGRPSSLKLSVRVLPFALPPAPIEMAMCYPRPPQSDAMLRKQLVDMREHGCTAIEPAMDVQIKTRDQTLGDDDVAATRAHCKRMMDAAKEVFGTWRFPATFGVGHQIAYYWDRPKNWFAFWPHSEKIEGDLLRAIDVVREQAKAQGWPPLRAYALDEAGAHNLLDEAVHYYRLIKQRRPDLTTWTTIGGGMAMGHDEIGQLSACVDVLTTNRFTPEIARALVARGKPYGVYNGCGPTPAGARFFFGFYGWKTGAGQIAQWVYHFGNGIFEGSGLRQGDEGYAYLAPDGPLPSLMWEAAREGIDDYRYASLLWQMIAAAKAAKGAAAKEAAQEAEQALTGLLARIGWGFQALDGSQRTPPPHPATLRKWRGRLARQILKLRPLVGDERAAKAARRRPSPLALPWAEPPRETRRYGPELLPPSGFEKELAPWRVEAWNGKGTGELDAAVRHSGRRSLRIAVPARSGSQAVTVLVWPSWGKAKLNLALQGGRVYELSAWARWQDRATPPSLRIALPPGAAKATRTGKDEPDAQGWQRIWTRADMSFPALPKYLAVWVQGPGTVWLDALSLREAIPQPLALSLDQAEYDRADRVAVATVSVSRGTTPAQVRFVLSRRGGGAVARLTAPFQSHVAAAGGHPRTKAGLTLLTEAALRRCRILFDPSRLTPGGYQAKAELLDARGHPVAAEATTFERLPD